MDTYNEYDKAANKLIQKPHKIIIIVMWDNIIPNASECEFAKTQHLLKS